jgi:hypothetical protein
MEKTISVCKENFNTIRTGRANAAVLDRIVVDYYDTPTPLKSLCAVSTPDATTLLLSPFEKKALGDIEKALLKADLGERDTLCTCKQYVCSGMWRGHPFWSSTCPSPRLPPCSGYFFFPLHSLLLLFYVLLFFPLILAVYETSLPRPPPLPPPQA